MGGGRGGGLWHGSRNHSQACEEDQTSPCIVPQELMYTGSNILCLLLLIITVFISVGSIYSSEAPCSWFLCSVQYMCCIIHPHPTTLFNITATICVGHHVVILFRHSAYDGSWSVTADVAGPIGAINKRSAAMACSHKLLQQIVWGVKWHVWSCNQFDPPPTPPKKPRLHLASWSIKASQ